MTLDLLKIPKKFISLKHEMIYFCLFKIIFLQYKARGIISGINRSSRPEMLCKKGVLRNFTKLACNFIKKETLAQVFSCEFYEISKKIFFHRTPMMAASVSIPLI